MGVMIGRPFRQDLWLLRQLDEHFYGPSEKMEITDVLSDYQDYLLQEIDRYVPWWSVSVSIILIVGELELNRVAEVAFVRRGTI